MNAQDALSGGGISSSGTRPLQEAAAAVGQRRGSRGHLHGREAGARSLQLRANAQHDDVQVAPRQGQPGSLQKTGGRESGTRRWHVGTACTSQRLHPTCEPKSRVVERGHTARAACSTAATAVCTAPTSSGVGVAARAKPTTSWCSAVRPAPCCAASFRGWAKQWPKAGGAGGCRPAGYASPPGMAAGGCS